MVKFKVIIEIIGPLAGLAGFAAIFIGEMYIVGGLLVILGLTIAFYLVYQHFLEPITWKKLWLNVEISNSKGTRASVEKGKTFVVNAKNVTQIVDQNISGSGNIEFVGTSIGETIIPIDEGGTRSAYTTFRAALPVGEELKHVIKFNALDSFLEAKETATLLIDRRYEQIEFRISFPQSRPPRRPRLYEVYKGRATELDNSLITVEDNRLSANVSSPKVGGKYILEWQW